MKGKELAEQMAALTIPERAKMTFSRAVLTKAAKLPSDVQAIATRYDPVKQGFQIACTDGQTRFVTFDMMMAAERKPLLVGGDGGGLGDMPTNPYQVHEYGTTIRYNGDDAEMNKALQDMLENLREMPFPGDGPKPQPQPGGSPPSPIPQDVMEEAAFRFDEWKALSHPGESWVIPCNYLKDKDRSHYQLANPCPNNAEVLLTPGYPYLTGCPCCVTCATRIAGAHPDALDWLGYMKSIEEDEREAEKPDDADAWDYDAPEDDD